MVEDQPEKKKGLFVWHCTQPSLLNLFSFRKKKKKHGEDFKSLKWMEY